MLWICSSANFGEKKCYSREFVIESDEKKKTGGEGYRSPYLSHAKREIYHLSYTPVCFDLKRELEKRRDWKEEGRNNTKKECEETVRNKETELFN